jgi:hypothetical protein
MHMKLKQFYRKNKEVLKVSIDFKWDTEDADLVCIHKVNAIAVYQNCRNEIVIRQEMIMGTMTVSCSYHLNM